MYIIIYVYFMIFNWKIFTLKLDINLGLAQVQLPPFIILFLLGLTFLIILTWISYITNLQKIIYDLEQGKNEKMSDKIVINKVKEQFKDHENIETLKTRLGISEIRSKQDELIAMISNLQKDLDTRNQTT